MTGTRGLLAVALLASACTAKVTTEPEPRCCRARTVTCCGGGRSSPGPALPRTDERRLQVSRIYYGHTDGPGQEIDPSGTTLAGDLPHGTLRALSDEYAVFALSPAHAYEVYRIG